MDHITLNTAALLCGLSKRTLWRRVAAGRVRTADTNAQGENARVVLDDVLALLDVKLDDGACRLIQRADEGDAGAQCELGLVFLGQARTAQGFGWLSLAARQHHPEAMYQLGRCYIAGLGVEADASVGAEWISRAAAIGHELARHLAHFLIAPDRVPLPSAELDAELDRIERERVVEVLREVTVGTMPDSVQAG